jgi:predicted ArsR family transcriptional regulator
MTQGDSAYRLLELLAQQPKGWTRIQLIGQLEMTPASLDREISDLKRRNCIIAEPQNLGKKGRPMNRYYCTSEGFRALNRAFRKERRNG